MLAPQSKPYLSIVVSSRNDNHGGDLNRRTQTFINSVAEQCQRHRLRAELIFVEWNPPEDRGPLADELDWPDCGGWCSYRIITVPREVHLGLACGDKLPLYQMLAKNVGIRRALGEHVLATNVDLIFSNELAAWLAKRPLKQGHYYRTDRYDVPMDVMGLQGSDEQLTFCRNNLLRVHTKYGTIDGADWSYTPLPGIAWWRHMRQKIRHVLSDRNEARGPRAPRPPVLRRLGSAVWNMSPRNAVRYSARMGRLSVRLARGTARLAKRIAFHYAKVSLASIPRAVRFAVRPTQWKRASLMGLKRRLRNWTNPLGRMHTNGCGDFTLMSREDWSRLGGYAELEIFSWHLDSLLVYSAFHSGMLERHIPHHLYHIEHRGGWTPESADGLWKRLREKEIPFLTNEDLDLLHERIQEAEGVYEFNDQNWGMAHRELPDEVIAPKMADLEPSGIANSNRAA
ncbi:MAG: hypothetical protein MPJ50_08990 [Pirellulales bacterium]|nr:hypothetical protein [Pirellulales bacterium]